MGFGGAGADGGGIPYSALRFMPSRVLNECARFSGTSWISGTRKFGVRP